MNKEFTVAGRNPHTIIKPCKDVEEAHRVANQMIADGFKKVTIDNKPFDGSPVSSNGGNK